MRYLFILLILLVNPSSLIACDMCNCYLGLNPGYNKNTIGFRGSVSFASLQIPSQNLRIAHLGNNEPLPVAGGKLNERFIDFNLFARIYPLKKLQVIIDLPYSINTLDYDGMSSTRSALSDLSVITMYQIANTKPKDSTSVRHRFFAGGGLKLPTGKYKTPAEVLIPMADDLYSGTGSFDYIFALTYIGKVKNVGWNADVNYKINTPNKINYKYGNTINITPRVFYQLDAKSLTVFPHVGATYENGKIDTFEGTPQISSGGKLIWGSAGIDLYYKSISLSTEARIPVYHHVPEGVPMDNSWFMTSINVHF